MFGQTLENPVDRLQNPLKPLQTLARNCSRSSYPSAELQPSDLWLARRSARGCYLQRDWPVRTSGHWPTRVRNISLTSGPRVVPMTSGSRLHLKGTNLVQGAVSDSIAPLLCSRSCPLPLLVPLLCSRRHGFVGRWRGIFHRPELPWHRCKLFQSRFGDFVYLGLGFKSISGFRIFALISTYLLWVFVLLGSKYHVRL